MKPGYYMYYLYDEITLAILYPNGLVESYFGGEFAESAWSYPGHFERAAQNINRSGFFIFLGDL